MGKAAAQIEISASSSRLGANLSSAYGKFMAFGSTVARGVGRAFSKINFKPGETMKRAVGNFGGDMMGRGLDALVDTAHNVRDFESDLQRLGQTTHATPAKLRGLRDSLRETSLATGIDKNELAKGAATYFDLTSDAEGMSSAIAKLGRVSQASGASLEDLVRASAAAKDNMGVGADEIESLFSGLIMQGEAGKVTLKEMGTELPSLLAMFSKFGTGREGVMQLSAAWQVGAKAFGSASQSATGLEAMMGMLQARQKQLHGQGVEVYKVNKDGSVTLRSLASIVDDIRKKNIDPRKFGKIFGENKEGRNFLEMLLKFPDLYKQIVDAGQNSTAVQEYAMARAQSDAGRLDIALNKLKVSIADAFTPERIAAFTSAVENLVDKVGPLVDSLGKITDMTLGTAFGLGKSIRGVVEGSANPFVHRLVKSRADKNGVFGIGSSDNSKGDLALQRNARGWQQAADRILGSEQGGRTSKASLRAAYIASEQQGGFENLGASTAGESYLRNAGVTKQQVTEAWGKEVVEAGEKTNKLLAEIAKKVGQSPTVQIGDNQNARSVAKSTDARRNTR